METAVGRRNPGKSGWPPSLRHIRQHRLAIRADARQRRTSVTVSHRATRPAIRKRVSWLISLSVLLPLAAVYAQGLGNGDVNGDGVVDNTDLQAVVRSWGTTSGPADQYGDGLV